MALVSRRLGARVAAIAIPIAEAAIDVDKPADLDLVEAILTPPGEPDMTAPPIAMISNPLSERNRSGMADIEAVLRGRRGIEHIRFEPGMDLQAVLAGLAARECGLLILNSGDGLVHGVLGALFLGAAFERPPPLALLPRGMTNMTAADVGLGGRDAGTLVRLLDIAAAGRGRGPPGAPARAQGRLRPGAAGRARHVLRGRRHL